MKGVVRSLEVHHQSLAFRARLYDAKNKAPEQEAGISTRQTLSLNTTLPKNGEVGGRGGAISLVRWGSIGGREERRRNGGVFRKSRITFRA